MEVDVELADERYWEDVEHNAEENCTFVNNEHISLKNVNVQESNTSPEYQEKTPQRKLISDKNSLNKLLDTYTETRRDCGTMAMHNDTQLEIETSSHEQDSNYGDDVQELLDDQIISCIVKEPSKRFAPLYSVDSDEESSDSNNNYDSNDDNDCFIHEIIADDEPRCSGRGMEQMRKQVGCRSKQLSTSKTIRELIDVQRLVLERDKLLIDLETKFQQELYENLEKQKQIRDKLYYDKDNIKILEPSVSRCFFKKFGMPYFEDHNGFSAPPNDDHKKKMENGELVVTLIPKVRCWQKHHKDMLMKAVHNSLIEEHCDKVKREIDKLKQQLKKNKGDKILLAKVKDHHDDINRIRNRSYSDLVTKESFDREYDWMKFSVTVFNGIHSPEECRRFWHLHVKPSINKDSWTNTEDLKLLEVAEEMQYEDWDAIAQLLGTGRSAYQCFVHFRTRLHANQNFLCGKWTSEEDRKLMSVISASKIGNFIPWTKVSSHVDNRTHSQIYNRWKNSLNPNLVKGRFTKEEDILVVSGIEVFGMSYKEMASLMSNRSCNQIRERYERYFLTRKTKVGTWSLEEDEKLLRLIQTHGEQSWTAVSRDMKTRTRTQVRQRYNFIKQMRKNNPSWSVSQVKRRNIHKKTPVLIRTEKYVEKVKQEIEKVEEAFSLSKLERDTFRVEKLKELRDRVLFKRIEPKQKKRFQPEGSKINNLLIEYFKYSLSKPQIAPKRILQNINFDACSKEMLMMAKYFGHELQLPKNVTEIKENRSLSSCLKQCLLESMDSEEDGAFVELTRDEPSCSSSTPNRDNIDYTAPDTDNSLIMNNWWHTPPFDISKLNFSEFYKRTIYDYSYGMHQDIWASKQKRALVTDCYSPCKSDLSKQPVTLFQPLFMPPNLVTTTGLKSLLLSRTRLRKEATVRGFLGNILKISDNGDGPKTNHIDGNSGMLSRFQDTMITLFTWPKVLSLTSIESVPISSNSFSSKSVRSLNKRHLSNKGQQKQGELYKADHMMKLNQSCYNENLFKRHKLNEVHKGIRCRRKMAIEHLIKVENDAKLVVVPKGEKKCIAETKQTKSKLPKCDDSVQNNRASSHEGKVKVVEIETPQFNRNKGLTKYRRKNISAKYWKGNTTVKPSIPAAELASMTYTKPQRKRTGHEVDIKSCEPPLKRTKLEKNKENITIQPDFSKVEHCLEINLNLK